MGLELPPAAYDFDGVAHLRRPSRWLLRSGYYSAFLTFVLVVALSLTLPLRDRVTANMILTTQSPAANVTAPGNPRYVASGYVSADGPGFLRRGQEIYLECEGFPVGQFGRLRGQVSDIANVAVGGRYRVNAALPQGLVTTRGVRIPFTQRMPARAIIIVNSRTIAQSLVGYLRSENEPGP